MKRSTLMLILATMVAVNAAPVFADKNDNWLKRLGQNQQQNQQQSQQRRSLKFQSPLSNSPNLQQAFKKHKKPHDQKPIDPGQGDGRVPVEPATPQGVPGYVFVDGHWQREKAQQQPKVINPTQTQGTPVVRDHRPTTPPPLASGQGGGTTMSGGVIVRDHRGNSGGDEGTSSGPIIRDHRTSGPVVRDHRSGK